MSDTPISYDIFSGSFDKDAVWQCSIEGLWNAKIKMDALSAERPGKYFIFYVKEQAVVAKVDTGKPTAQDHVA